MLHHLRSSANAFLESPPFAMASCLICARCQGSVGQALLPVHVRGDEFVQDRQEWLSYSTT
jgi:hypothetical protein